MRVIDHALQRFLRDDTRITTTIGAGRIHCNHAPEGAEYPLILIDELTLADSYTAGGRKPGPSQRAVFHTATYHVQAIDAHDNPGRAGAIESLLLRRIEEDGDDLFGDGDEAIATDPDNGWHYSLLDMRATGRIRRSEVVDRPAGAALWYRGVVLQIELQRLP